MKCSFRPLRSRVTDVGAALDPVTAAELRQLRALARRQAQELEILKKAIAIFSQTPDQ